MATLYRPRVVRYTLNGKHRTPDGQHVTASTPGAKRTRTVSKVWYGRYRDGNGEKHQVKLSANKEIARRMLAKISGDAQLAGVGIADPYADHRARPLTEHVEDYRRYLEAKGDTPEHVAKTASRIQATLRGCEFKTLDDLAEGPVVEFLATLRSRGTERIELPARQQEFTKAELVAFLDVNPGSVARMLQRSGLTGTGQGKARRYSRTVLEELQARLCQGTGLTTCNHYLTAMKGFTHWLSRGTKKRIPMDPLADLSRQNADTDVRHPRRALREDLFSRFVEATAEGKELRGLTGADRLVLYTLAAQTGFRAGELASLTPASFDLDATPPTVTVEAGYSKRRRKDVQPLRADVAEMMRQYLAGRPRNQPVWPGTWVDVAADLVRADLTASGIPYKDEAGRHFDFHAMRGQFISFLAAAGVHPKVAQQLARHSTITLTMDHYTHLDVLDVRGALDKLPGVPVSETKSAQPVQRACNAPDGQRATG